ncbi:MAG TPA: cupin domain-containing protein [Chloroflexota bacterium]|nr:cupin domain-containing protein [Chloroflexota bacterium]
MSERRWHRLYFDEWVESEGLELIRGYKIEDVHSVPLRPWARTGGNAVWMQLEGTGGLNGGYICEIPAGKQLEPKRQLFEELIYILSGQGSSMVWYEGQPKRTFEWTAGSLFAIPLNAWHQHFNGSGSTPVRFLSVTTAPITLNLIRDASFVFNCDATFPDRYAGEDTYFSGEFRMEEFLGWGFPVSVAFSNLYPDIHAVPFTEVNRGVGVRHVQYELANGVSSAHRLEMPGGTFTKLHRHGPGAHVLWLKGEGYTVMWPDGGEMVQEFWRPGTMMVPPEGWWHQHAVVSQEPGLHLALKFGSRTNSVTKGNMASMKSARDGGNQLEYDDIPKDTMDKLVAMFAEECARRGTPARMEAIIGG